MHEYSEVTKRDDASERASAKPVEISSTANIFNSNASTSVAEAVNLIFDIGKGVTK